MSLHSTSPNGQVFIRYLALWKGSVLVARASARASPSSWKVTLKGMTEYRSDRERRAPGTVAGSMLLPLSTPPVIEEDKVAPEQRSAVSVGSGWPGALWQPECRVTLDGQTPNQPNCQHISPSTETKRPTKQEMTSLFILESTAGYSCLSHHQLPGPVHRAVKDHAHLGQRSLTFVSTHKQLQGWPQTSDTQLT
ncbi:hypothetical protein EYF80_003520 [Liparis tanakae]|uniref:Uncharacterized protein n=1 Tax=Liparis tanakae TaxID=230148 RepID=A0A4Z2J8W5_9TELE|nr:hypothetical protein EYF80_003520 [Liparis tanakae]